MLLLFGNVGCEQNAVQPSAEAQGSAASGTRLGETARNTTPTAVASGSAPSEAPSGTPGQDTGTSSSTASREAPGAAVDVNDKGIPRIPDGRSEPPTAAEWQAGLEVNTQGVHSRPPGCAMKIVREWLKVHCTGNVTRIADRRGLGKEGHDYFEHVEPGKVADFVVRLRPAGAQGVRIWREPRSIASLFVSWPPKEDRPLHVALGYCLPEQPCWHKVTGQ
jgi:hypothetical protein